MNDNINFENMDSMRLDTLKELGNIGAGNATTALSQMINQKVDMGVPVAKVLEFKELSNTLGGEENPVVGLLFNLEGDVEGMMMFVLEQKSAHHLVNLLMGRKLESFQEFSEMDLSAIQEIGNIIAGAYLSSLASITNLKIISSIPYLAIDMAGAILSVPAIEFSKIGDKALLIQTGFGGDDEDIIGNFILIPEINSYDKIFTSLGM